MSAITFVIYSEEPDAAEELAKLIELGGDAEVIARVSDEGLLRQALEKEKPQFLLTDLGHAPHGMLDVIERLPEPRPKSIVFGPEDQSDVILRALKQGVREFFSDASTPDQFKELTSQLAAQARAEKSRGQGAGVIAVMGAKGGVGATLAACQLAGCLQRAGGGTAIVDLNIPLGDVAVYFDVQPAYTLADVARAGDRVDATLIGDLLERHVETGVEVLAAPSRVEDAELVREGHVQILLEQLKQRFDWVVVDVSRTWNETSMRAVDMADHVVLVTLQDVPSLNHARAHRDLLLRLGKQARSIHTIVNRESKDAAVSPGDMARFLGVSPEFSVPNDYATATTIVNEGRSVADVAPGTPIDRAFQDLVARVYDWHGVSLDKTEAPKGLGRRIRSIFERS